ncbi:MAG: type II restriction endonuclease [Candidatus Syntropharchaeia archaeon]
MTKEELKRLMNEFRTFLKNLERYLNDEEGYWALRGFIDVAKNVYSISSDTKLISKALEIMIIPVIKDFFAGKGFKVVLSPEQNFYPDIGVHP